MVQLTLPTQLASALCGVGDHHLLRLREAATLLETSPAHLRDLVAHGVLRGQRVGSTLLFDPEELARAAVSSQLATCTADLEEHA